ncbi:MAG TPA: pyrroloquinoline quinone biosynthesis protein PqqB [Jiangellaceae bacterium]|nr:pyrroloquinoline quinone biosynthesis protein PqqB [Jiangellaceae bacterium]
MWLRVLGSAAGGGFPQWNCRCPTCQAVRDGSRPCRARTQSSIAISADRDRWFLGNASPDIRAQIEASPALQPRDDRVSPLQSVLLTDAEIDHTLGLLLLREGQGVTVHATEPTHETLRRGTSILTTLEHYCPVDWRPVEPGADVALAEGLSYRAVDVPTTKHARFGVADHESGRVVGYRFTNEDSGRFAVYLPGVQELTPALRAEIDGAAVLLIDGTCWHDDELKRLGLGHKTAHDMGHLAVGDPGGSLDQLATLRVGRAIYVHINNTNPMLIEDSPERRMVEERGVDVATDGLEVEIP